jgi:hypothetical protein
MYFIGDTHGIRPIFSIIDKHKLENQNLIHVGDLGLGFQEITRDIQNLLVLDEMLLETNNHLYAIRGNHDNPIFWDRSKGLWLPKLHNVHLLDDYSVRKIENKTILFIGGAISIDRRPRMAEFPPSWWKDEEFVLDLEKIDAIASKTPSIDIVVTHTAPDFCYPTDDNVSIVNHYHAIELAHGIDLKQQLRNERSDLTEIYNNLTHHYGHYPSHWLYGHFHSTKKKVHDKTEFKLLNINELYEIN